MIPHIIKLLMLTTCLALWMSIAPVRAELEVIEGADGQQGLTVFRMTVTPAAEPGPALKHRLTLREFDLVSGNAATSYMRGFAESSLSGRWRAIRNEFGDEADDWYDIDDVSIQDLPLDKMRNVASRFDSLVTFCIRPASRSKDCDWGLGLENLEGTDIYNYLLPDFQESRAYSRMLALLTRLAIAEHRYNDAIDYLRMNYRLAYNVGKGPFFVCGLIGLAEAGIANKTLIDLIAAEDSPNLYWALAELPDPIVDLRQSVRYEMSLLPRVLSSLDGVESKEHTADEWARVFHQGFEEFQKADEAWNLRAFKWLPKQELSRKIVSAGVAILVYPEAKQRLIHSGMSAETVEAMPAGQVILLDTAREIRRISDELEKWFYVDFPLARDHMNQASSILDNQSIRGGLGPILTALLMPALQSVHTANARLEWQLSALQTIEALRMHASVTGSLPNSLDEIQVVPVPRNPITQQHYVYRLEGTAGLLELPFSDGMPGVAWRFEIQLADQE